MVTATAIRRHVVAISPAAIIGTVGFIVIHATLDLIVVSISAARDNAARQKDRQRSNSKSR
jgi:hypothetical protein